MASVERLCSKDEVPPGSMKYFKVKGNEIVLANAEGSFYALQNWCTHEQGDLSAGTLKGHTLKCPEHGAEFDVRSGKVLLGPDGEDPSTIDADTKFETTVIGNDVYVTL